MLWNYLCIDRKGNYKYLIFHVPTKYSLQLSKDFNNIFIYNIWVRLKMPNIFHHPFILILFLQLKTFYDVVNNFKTIAKLCLCGAYQNQWMPYRVENSYHRSLHRRNIKCMFE